jgi:SAM-dependent methyltransferase
MSNPAEGYEGYMVPTLFGPWATRLVQAANLQPGERVLDIGCGTGVVTRHAARMGAKGASFTAVDISPQMLEVARGAAAREGVTADWRQGKAEALPFRDGAFDLVLCQFALMFFADRSAALGEMRRVLAPNGRAALSVWQGLDRHPFYLTLHNVIEQRLGISALQAIFSLGDAEGLRAMVTRAGFRQVDVRSSTMTARFPNPAAFLAGEIEVDTAAIPEMRKLDARAREAIVTAITGDMTPSLEGVTQDHHVVLPFHAHIATARR